MMYTDQFIRDYNHVDFQNAFRAYFTELGIQVTDWNGLFQQMTDEGVLAIVRKNEQGTVIGFIQFSRIEMTSWFFEERYGFIQEFWIAPEYRGQGQGTSLLKQAEGWFEKQGFAYFGSLNQGRLPYAYGWMEWREKHAES